MLVCIAVTAVSQPAPIQIRSGAGTKVQGRPGTLLTIPVQFVNTSGRQLNVRPSVALPSGWRRVAAPGDLVLFPGGNDLQLLIVSIPRDAGVRIHSVTVFAFVDGDTAAAARIEFRVAIERTVTVDALLMDAPRTIVAGTTGEFSYEVTNRGNDTARVILTARSSRGYEPQVTPRVVGLPAGSSARVTVRVPSDEGERLKAPHMLEFTARLQPEGTEIRITTASDVVPRAPSAELKKFEFPLFATLRGTSESGRSAVQAEVVGGGSFRADRSDHLEFLLRGPETQTVSVLGLRDEYRVRYEFGRSSVTVGDDNYALTPLTDVGRTAVGVNARTELGDVSLGAFVNQTRFSGPVARQSAGWVRYDVSDDLNAGLNYLHRSDRVVADIVSFTASGAAFRSARYDVEAGRSTGTRGPDNAYAVRFGGMEPWLSYELRHVNAGAAYAGYYRGVRFSSLSLSGRNDRDIRLEFSARDERRAPESDTAFGKVPRSNFLQLGVGYTNLITVSYRATNLSDPASSSPSDRRQDIVEIRSAADLGAVFLSASAELGTERDRSTGMVGPTQRLVGSLSARLGARQSYNLSVEHDRSPDPLTGIRADRLSANLLASYILAERTQAAVTLFGSRLSGPSAQSYSLVEASVDHVFPSDHRMRLHGRRSLVSGTTPELAVALEYSVPLAVPLGADRSSGLVRGRIVESGNRGIPAALVTLGAFAAITDDNGQFAFNNLSPGAYSLSLDRATVGIDRITTVALPLEVSVSGGVASIVTLTVIRAATLRGRLRSFERFTFGDSAAALTERPVEDNGLVTVELENGPEILRRVSDSRGRFLFTDLRPGRWTMRVAPLNLPADRSIETPETAVEITEGAALEAEIRIVPRRRTIRLVQQGGVLTPQRPDNEQDEVCGAFLIRRATQGEGFVVQVSSWETDEKARTEAGRMQGIAAGRRVWIENKPISQRGTFHRVLVGPFPTRESAREWSRSAAD
ncbi:MAG: SPOR domain-containing protein [Bacteroidota bacterium]